MSYLPPGPHSIDDFLDVRPELPEGGQWCELTDGEITLFEAPDTDHGLVVSHLTKKLTPLSMSGTPVFRPALRLRSKPDTVRYPAVGFFADAGRFDLMDADAIDEAPAWVIEIASTGDRRRAVQPRTADYVAWGVQLVWVIDPRERSLIVVHEGTQKQHGERAVVSAKPVIDIDFPLADLFEEPAWWGGK